MRQLMKDIDDAEPQAAAADKRLTIQYVNARLELHMTQQQLAEVCGLPQSVIARFESGKSSPTLRTMQRIAKALNKKLTLKAIA